MNIEPGFGRDAVNTDLITEQTADERRLRNRRVLLIAGAVLALVLAVIFVRQLIKPESVPESPPSVTVIVPGKTVVTRVIATTGTLAARREMPVGVAGEGGMIEAVLVEPGDWVGAGQILARIDASVQVQQAAQLRAQIAVARADAALADAELGRAQALVGRGFISQADVDRKTAARDSARARVGVAQAQLGEVQARIARLSIRAPAAGLVLTRDVEPGQVVGSGNGALFRLAREGEMELRAKLTDGDLSTLNIGDPVDVVPVGSNRHFTGTIWQLAPVVDPVSRQGEARIRLAYDKALRPGSFAGAKIRNGRITVPLLPESAVLSDDKGNFVYIIDPDEKAVRRDVRVGTVSDTGLPIVAGLSGQEMVVLSSGAFLSPGDIVTPVLSTRRR